MIPGYFGIEKEEESPLLDADTIKEALEADIELKDTEAVNILERHLNTEYLHVSNRQPNSSDLEKAMTTANNFLKTNLYDHISETDCAEYLKLETVANPKETAVKIEKDILKNLDEAKLKRPFSHTADLHPTWIYISQGKDTNYDYRMYLSPGLENVGAVLKDLVLQMPSNSTYRMKTIRGQERLTQVTRRDPIIMYFAKEELSNVVNAVNGLIEKNPGYFKGRPVPPGGKYSPHDGISFAKEIKHTSGTQILVREIAGKLETALEPKVTNHFKELLESGQDILSSDEAKILWGNYKKIEDETQEYFHTFTIKNIPQHEREDATKLYLSLFQDNTLRYCFGMGGKDFDKEAKEISPNMSEQTLKLLRYETTIEWIRARIQIRRMMREIGLTIEILKKIRAGENVGDVIKEYL